MNRLLELRSQLRMEYGPLPKTITASESLAVKTRRWVS